MKIDGDLSEYRYGWTVLRNSTTGETPPKNGTRAIIAMAPRRSGLIVGAICHENRMDQLKADSKTNDDAGIFKDDVVEIYVSSPEHSYFRIVVNPNAAVWTETTDVATIERDTLPILWNPDIEVAVRKFPDRWTVEIEIPTEDLGKVGPTRTFPWGIQVARNRLTGGHPSRWAIAPTSGQPVETTNLWANLWMR